MTDDEFEEAYQLILPTEQDLATEQCVTVLQRKGDVIGTLTA